MCGFKIEILMKVYLTIQSNYSEKSALQTLKASDWHLEGAFDVFYSQPQSKSFTDSRHLEELFNRYKGKLYLNSCFCSLSSTSLLCLFLELLKIFFFPPGGGGGGGKYIIFGVSFKLNLQVLVASL